MSVDRAHRVVNPADWARPSGYSNGMLARGTSLFIAGQIGWDRDGRIVAGDFVAQTRQALRNIVAVLEAAGASTEHVVRLTWYVTDIARYRSELRAIGEVYRETMGRHFPTMSAVAVSALVEPDAMVEIEATAVIPDA